MVSQNSDKFLASFDDDAASNVTYRIVLLIDAVNRLTEYDTEIKPIAEALAPLDVLNEMLRVADKCIVTFPNFAHWSVRFTFSLGGRMPVTKSLPHTWYNTPNIHLCSLTDFMDWVRSDGVDIQEAWVLVDGKVLEFDPTKSHNIIGEQALFVIHRG